MELVFVISLLGFVGCVGVLVIFLEGVFECSCLFVNCERWLYGWICLFWSDVGFFCDWEFLLFMWGFW